MDGKLLDGRLVMSSSSSEILGRRRNASTLGRINRGGLGFCTHWSCSFVRKGISVKAAATSSSTPVQASNSWQGIDSSSHQRLVLGNESSSVNGMNAGLLLSPRSSQSFVLDAHEDEYEGIVVDPHKLPLNPKIFFASLRTSLSHWKLKGKKGVWLKIPLEQSGLVPIAVKMGFVYHHAERDYLMLTYWIPKGPCMLPANASHQVGVGGFVINDKNEVLVVQEKHTAPAFKCVWKLPTGFITEAEEIYNGVVREVKEETGIDTDFVEVIAFRHAHQVAFEKSDLFFICMLKPLNTQIAIDDLEIQAAKWMPLSEFVEQQCIQGDNMFRKIIDICIARLGERYCGLSAHHLISKFDGKTSSLYYSVVEPQEFNCIVE